MLLMVRSTRCLGKGLGSLDALRRNSHELVRPTGLDPSSWLGEAFARAGRQGHLGKRLWGFHLMSQTCKFWSREPPRPANYACISPIRAEVFKPAARTHLCPLKREEPGYFPRRITVVAPLGEAVYHLVIQGTDEVGALAKVTSVIAKHRVNLISGGTYDAQGGQKFLFSVFADLAHADCSSDGLAAELQGLPCVLTVSVTQTEDVIYEQRLFPVMLFDDNRAVIMPGESIAFMERDLNKQLGVQGLQVIFEVGRSSG